MNALVRNAAVALLVAAFGAAGCSSTNNNPPDAGGLGGKAGAGGAAGRASAQGTGGQGGNTGAAGTTGTVIVSPGVGYLWYAGDQLNAFTQDETTASNDDGPGITVAPSSPSARFHDLAFDRDGQLWTVPTTGDQILRLPAASLGGGSGPAVPNLVLTSPGLVSPQSLAFDPAGNLWVVNFAGAGVGVANIVCFKAPQAWSGNMNASPSVTISPAADAQSMGQFIEGTALAFDSKGSLWFASVSTVLRIDSPGTLAGAVTAAPAAAISTGDAYTSIAFDTNGSLWISATTQGYVALRIDNPGALTGLVSPTPAARVGLSSANAVFVGGLSFDKNGALWVMTSNRILEITSPAALVGQVTASPAVTLGLPAAVMSGLASKLVFRPTPAGLPIY